MKRALALLLAFTLCVSLCSCSGKQQTNKYIGVWQSKHYRLTITKGGIGEFEFLSDPNAVNVSLDWEVKDGVLVVKSTTDTYEFSIVYELNDDASSLNIIHSSLLGLKDGDAYIKIE